jgi:hypothetical protein
MRSRQNHFRRHTIHDVDYFLNRVSEQRSSPHHHRQCFNTSFTQCILESLEFSMPAAKDLGERAAAEVIPGLGIQADGKGHRNVQ